MDMAAVPSVALCNSALVIEFYQGRVSSWHIVVALSRGVCSVEPEESVRSRVSMEILAWIFRSDFGGVFLVCAAMYIRFSGSV
jgi:hypothetical protein